MEERKDKFIPKIGMRVKKNISAISQDYEKTGTIIFVNRRHRFYGVEFAGKGTLFSSLRMPTASKKFVECYKY